MADVPKISEYHSLLPLGVHDDAPKHDGRRGRQPEDAEEKALAARRSPRQIADVASVMGIPARELTPRVHEALELILNEFDRVRSDLDIAREHEARLQVLADSHPFLPVFNRRALFAQMVRLSEHAARTETESTLVLLGIANIERIKAEHGIAVRDAALRQAADAIRNTLQPIDVVGEVGTGEFAIILNVTSLAEAEATAAELAAALAAARVDAGGVRLPLEPVWGAVPLAAEVPPEQLIGAAEQAMHRRIPQL